MYGLSKSFYCEVHECCLPQDKMIQIKPYTICSSHKFGLEVERPERSTTFSYFSLFFTIKEIVLVLGDFHLP